MRLVFIKKRSLEIMVMLSITAVVLNLVSIEYFANYDMQNVNMSVLSGHTIAIDPGHGGIDSGANSNNVEEKDVTLAISLKLAKVLQSHDVNVIFTRDGDIDYYTRGRGGKRNDLLKRVEIIDSSGSDIYVSIHCNAIRGASLSGSQVFYNPKLAENKILAERIQQNLKEFPKGNKRQAKEDLHILLLKRINIPGVLIETGYLTNKQEAALLVDENYQQNLVEHIAQALAYHFSQNAAK